MFATRAKFVKVCETKMFKMLVIQMPRHSTCNSYIVVGEGETEAKKIPHRSPQRPDFNRVKRSRRDRIFYSAIIIYRERLSPRPD